MSDTTGKDPVLELYRMAVRNMLAGDKPGAVPNASFKHASIIVEELARSAKLRFYAYCEKMSADVWTQPVIDQLRLAIGRCVDVRIVVTGRPEIELPDFLKGCVRALNLAELGDRKQHLEKVGHFAVVDGKSLRLEQNHKTREALFAANMPQIAGELEGIFTLICDMSEAA